MAAYLLFHSVTLDELTLLGIVHGLWFFSQEELTGFCHALKACANTRVAAPEAIRRDQNFQEDLKPSIGTLLNQALHRKQSDRAKLNRPAQEKVALSNVFEKIVASGKVTRRDDPANFLNGLIAAFQV